MLTILFYTYTVLAVAVITSSLVSLGRLLLDNKVTETTLSHAPPEKIQSWNAQHSGELKTYWSGLSLGWKIFSCFLISIICVVWCSAVYFMWWHTPVRNLKMVKDCLTNNFVDVQ